MEHNGCCHLVLQNFFLHVFCITEKTNRINFQMAILSPRVGDNADGIVNKSLTNRHLAEKRKICAKSWICFAENFRK
jgi:hypothetical protein